MQLRLIASSSYLETEAGAGMLTGREQTNIRTYSKTLRACARSHSHKTQRMSNCIYMNCQLQKPTAENAPSVQSEVKLNSFLFSF